MPKPKTKLFLLFNLLIFFTFCLKSQTTIYTLDFESPGAYTTSITEFFNGNYDFFTRTDGSNIGSAYVVSGIQGSYYFAAQDIDGGGASLPVYLYIDDVDIATFTNLQLKVYLAEDDDGSNQDWDSPDYVHFDYDIDNSGSFSNLLWIENDGSGTNSEPYIDTDYDGIGDGAAISSTFTQFAHDISGTGSLIDIRISFNLNSGDEDIAIDNIEITGYAPGEVIDPSDLTSTVISNSQINLSWTQNANGNDVMLAWSADGNFGTPVDGNSYAADDAISGGGTVIYNGSSSTFNHTSLSAGTQYYYKAWSVDGSVNYSAGITTDATTYKNEPSNHIASLSASPTPIAITLDWLDNDGAVVADGFLIKANTSNSFSSPVDGTAVSDDTDLSDGSAVVNIAHGTETYTFTGLNQSTNYYFKIWPYTNAASAIDYKTDGTIPSISSTTTSANLDLIISEVSDPADNAQARYVEIYNLSASVIDFDANDWYLCRQTNGGSWDDKKLTGSVNAGNAYTAANSNNDESDDFYLSYGFLADFDFGGFTGNGDDGYFLYYGGDHSTGILIDAYGVIDVDGDGQAWEYTDSKAVRRRLVSSANTTWTASEWIISPSSNVVNMTPGEHANTVTWLGTTDTDWNTKTNWDNGFIPDASMNTIIASAANQPSINNTQVYTNDLTLNSGTTVNMNVGKQLTVLNDLSVDAAANLNLLSDATGNASLIVEGSSTGNVNVNRYFEAYAGAGDGWHYISSPVNTMTIAGSDFEPGASDDLYAWDEDDYLWRNYKGSNFPGTSFQNGYGYMVAYSSTVNNTFNGELNNSDISFSNLSKTPSKGDGWHLIGNPFSSAIYWGTADWNLVNVGAVAKVYDESAGNYIDVSASGILPSTNGFFIQVSSLSNSFTIPKSSRVHNTSNNYKNTESDDKTETLKLIVNNDENSFYDVTNIAFRDDADIAFEWNYDAHKMFGQSMAPQLWTSIEGEDFSTNTLPPVYENMTVDLNFKAGVNSTFHLIPEGMESFYLNSEVYLEDLFTDMIIDLRETDIYTFQANTSDDNHRFKLHFYGITHIEDAPSVKDINIYTKENFVIVKMPEKSVKYNIQIYDIMGRNLLDKDVISHGTEKFFFDKYGSVLIVRITYNNKVTSEKVLLK